MRRRLPAILIAITGLAFIGVAVGARLFTVAPAFERMTTDFRPIMQPAQITQLQQDMNGLSAAQVEFTTKVAPQLQAALKMTPEQFAATMQQQFPAVSNGMQAIPTITGQFGGVLTTLDNEQGRFAKADAIPTKSASASTLPWVLVGVGLLALAALLLVPRTRVGAPLAVVLGLALVAAPIVMSLPTKASAADTMNAHFKPVYTSELVTGAKQSMVVMTAMGTEMQTKMMPALAQMLQLPPDQVQAFLAANFPAVTAALTNMPASLGRFDSLVTAFDARIDDYNTIKSTSFRPIVWFLIGAGLFIMLMGEWSFADQRAERPAARRSLRFWHHTPTTAAGLH